jgi:hypothetical protein
MGLRLGKWMLREMPGTVIARGSTVGEISPIYEGEPHVIQSNIFVGFWLLLLVQIIVGIFGRAPISYHHQLTISKGWHQYVWNSYKVGSPSFAFVRTLESFWLQAHLPWKLLCCPCCTLFLAASTFTNEELTYTYRRWSMWENWPRSTNAVTLVERGCNDEITRWRGALTRVRSADESGGSSKGRAFFHQR